MTGRRWYLIHGLRRITVAELSLRVPVATVKHVAQMMANELGYALEVMSGSPTDARLRVHNPSLAAHTGKPARWHIVSDSWAPLADLYLGTQADANKVGRLLANQTRESVRVLGNDQPLVPELKAHRRAGFTSPNPARRSPNPKGPNATGWVLTRMAEGYGRVFISRRLTHDRRALEMFTTEPSEAKLWNTRREADAAAKRANSGIWAFGWTWKVARAGLRLNPSRTAPRFRPHGPRPGVTHGGPGVGRGFSPGRSIAIAVSRDGGPATATSTASPTAHSPTSTSTSTEAETSTDTDTRTSTDTRSPSSTRTTNPQQTPVEVAAHRVRIFLQRFGGSATQEQLITGMGIGTHRTMSGLAYLVASGEAERYGRGPSTIYTLRLANPKGLNRWIVKDARGQIFWNGEATDQDEALMLAERSQAGSSDPPEPWTASKAKSNPKGRITSAYSVASSLGYAWVRGEGREARTAPGVWLSRFEAGAGRHGQHGAAIYVGFELGKRGKPVVIEDEAGKRIPWRTNPRGGPRIVYNRLLGGWYVVTGPHQAPLNGRFNSKAEAQAWLSGASRRRPNPRRRNPGERARAVRTFKKWHDFSPHRVTRVKAPSRIPRTMVKLGELEAIVYRSDKWAGGPDNPKGKHILYEHTTQRPRPVLATDPDGRDVFIVGGKMRVTADGLVH